MKQIYTAIQISEDEVRLLVGEYYGTRFNIIKFERVPCTGVKNFVIVDREAVKNAILQLCEKASKSIGAKVEQVILLLPSLNAQRYSLKVSVKTKNGYLTKEDVASGLNEAYRSQIDPDYIVVNAVIVRYTVNGISLRHLSEKEICDYFSIDVDLLCLPKNVAFDYVSLVEECELKIINVCLDNYAICKEASLFEQTMNHNIILLNVGKYSTTFTLLAKGKIVNCDYINEGLVNMSNYLVNTYSLPSNSAYRLLKYNSYYDSLNDKDRIVYASSEDNNNLILSLKEICDALNPSLNDFVKHLYNIFEPIITNGNTSITLVGEGSDMLSLKKTLEKIMQVNVNSYSPDTIGIRASELTALYGSFFVHRELAEIRKEDVCGVNLLELENLITKKENDAEVETLTTKIKNLFDTNKIKEA